MEGFDWKNFVEMAAIGTPFFNFVIRASVQYAKKLTGKDGQPLLHGNSLLLVSLLLGVVLGSTFMLLTNRPPEDPDWYAAVQYGAMLWFYGLIQGFLASGIYDSIKQELSK